MKFWSSQIKSIERVTKTSKKKKELSVLPKQKQKNCREMLFYIIFKVQLLLIFYNNILVNYEASQKLFGCAHKTCEKHQVMNCFDDGSNLRQTISFLEVFQ